MMFAKYRHSDNTILPRMSPQEMKGSFNIYSCFIELSYNEADFINSINELKITGIMDENFKTFVHEICHYRQFVGTSTGYFINQLRDIQFVLLNKAKEAINKKQIKISYPFINIIEELPQNDEYRELWEYIYFWYICEYILSWIDNKFDICTIIRESPFFNDLPIEYMYLILQEYILNNFCPFDVKLDWDKSKQKEFFNITRQATLNCGLNELLESAAFISELWGSPHNFDMDYFFHDNLISKNRIYTGLIDYFNSFTRIDNILEFVLTYLTVCDLSLMSPLPFEYKELKNTHNVNFWNCIPINRFYEIVSQLKNIEPVHNVNDYDRFVKQVCRNLEWFTPFEMIHYTKIRDKKPYFSYHYDLALNFRRERQNIFINMGGTKSRNTVKRLFFSKF